MKAVFQVLNDDGTQAMDSVTGEPHAFEFPIAPEAYAMIEGWMAGQTITNEAGETVPKWTNMGKIAAQFLYSGFKAMAPPAATADLVKAQQEAEAQKEARFAAMFGVSA